MCKMKMSMSRTFIMLAVLGAISVWTGACLAADDPSLIGWWLLNESGGTTAIDSSGNGNNGTLNGSAAFTAGRYGGGVYCDGTEGYVAIPGILPATCTLAFWFKPDWDGGDQADYRLFDGSAGDKYFFIGKGSTNTAMPATYFGFFFEDSTDFDFQNVRVTAAGAITAKTWCHVTVTWQFGGGAGVLYLNGVEVSRAANLGAAPTLSTNPRFGYATGVGGVAATNGAAAVFDDIKLFDRVLTTAEIPNLMIGAALEMASAANPADKATDLPRDTIMRWTPGIYAAAHDVYFGTNFADVNTASRTTPKDVLASKAQDANTFDPPGVLQYGQTYYWRIDEVNAAPSSTVFTGSTWSFTVEPTAYKMTNIIATASSEKSALESPQNTVNESGLTGDLHNADNQAMWVSNKTGPTPVWIRYDFDKTYKLYEMWVWNHNTPFESIIGLGAQDTTIEYSADGTTWTKLGDFQFAQAQGSEEYAHDTTVVFNGAAAKSVRITISSAWGGTTQAGLSEVRFLYIPVLAREPQPATDANGISPATSLSWRSGREAVSHNVYLGTDPNALTLAGAPATTSFAPASLSLGTKYYWRVDEVNTAEAVSTWTGDVWNFTTPDFLVVDDMESYNDTTNAIYSTWVDGYNTTTNGAQVGNDSAPFAETTTIHGGKQAMPFLYGKGGITTSEATWTFATAQDWTKYGVTTLTLFFYGNLTNTTGQLYVKINGTKVTYSNANALTIPWWTQWNIPLASVGVDLKTVGSLCIGVSGSATGTLLIDDIRLSRVPAAGEQLYIEAESATPAVPAPWTTADEALASGGKYITTPTTTTSSLDAPPTSGVATYNFTVAGGAYKVWLRLGPLVGYDNDSLWVRMKDATIDPVGNAANPGWIRCNGLAGQTGATGWHWGQVIDDEHASAQVVFTLPAGSHTLEIGYREPAVQIDAILISSN